MKLKEQFANANKLKSFEAVGNTWYFKPMSLKAVKKMQDALAPLAAKDNEDLSPLMYLFTNVLVEEDGSLFDDIAEGMTFEELEDTLTLEAIMEIQKGIMDSVNPQGN